MAEAEPSTVKVKFIYYYSLFSSLSLRAASSLISPRVVFSTLALIFLTSLTSHLFSSSLRICSYVREQDSACASAKFNHLEWQGLTSSCRLTIFLDEVASECESFVITFQFDVSSLVSHGSNRALYGRADRIFFLNCVPRVRGEGSRHQSHLQEKRFLKGA